MLILLAKFEFDTWFHLKKGIVKNKKKNKELSKTKQNKTKKTIIKKKKDFP